MSTQRREVQDDPEMESLKRGDPADALLTLRRTQAKNTESASLIKFFQTNRDIFPCTANEKVLLDWCSRKKAVAGFDLLQLALAEIRNSLVATPQAAPPPPTEAEIAAQEKSRLLSLDRAGLTAELAKRRYQKPAETVSADCALLKTKDDVMKLSGAEIRRLTFRPSDGSRRIRNTEYINQLFQGSN
jgi:hypothetical protein